MQEIIKFVGKRKYTESQGLVILSKECQKIGDVLREYEGKLR